MGHKRLSNFALLSAECDLTNSDDVIHSFASICADLIMF